MRAHRSRAEPRMKARIGKIAIAIITAIIIVSVVLYVKNNWGDFETIANLQVGGMALYLLFTFFAAVINGLSVKVLCASVGTNINITGWLGAKAIGGLIDTLLPLRVGSAFTAVHFKRAYRMNYSSYISLAAGSTVVSLLCQLMTAVITLLCLSAIGMRDIDPMMIVLLAFILATIFAVIILLLRFKDSAMACIPFKKYIGPVLHGFLELMKKRTILVQLVLLYVASVLIISCKNLVGFWIIGLPTDFFAALLYAVITILLSLFVILPGNWGINEIAFGAMAILLGDTFNSGMLLSLLSRISSLILYLSLSLLFIYPVYRREIRGVHNE